MVASTPHLRVVAPVKTDVTSVYAEHSAYVARLAFRLLGRSHEVDDLVQDVFLAAMSGLSGLLEPRAVRGWLATLTVRLAGRKLRRRKIAAFLSFDDGKGHDVTAPNASAEQQALLGQLYELLHELNVSERLAWTLHRIEGETLESVAVMLGCSLATAKRRIAVAQSHLQEALGDEP